MGDIFIVVDGQPDGPYDAEALRARLASGDFPRDIRASREGDDQWMPLTELIGEAPVATSKSAPPISEAKLRTGAWIALGALFLVAFLFPTPLNEGWGIVNLQTGWVNEPLANEFQSLSPDTKLLESIAAKTNGRLVNWNELDSLTELFDKRSAPITEAWSYPLWHNGWLFMGALSCFLAEWALRRKRGLA